MKRSPSPVFATFVVVVAVLPLLGATCADNVRPRDLTYAGTVGEYAEPLVVDWTPGQRGDLEIAMHEGVAIMAVDPDDGALKLLKNCRLDGEYGFIGISHKHQLVRLQNADEIRVNLPLTGQQLAGDLEGELSQGASLDVALVMIGKKKTTWRKAGHAELVGDCQGATHFVSGATVGAFCMETGSQGHARTVAEMFGRGGEATISSGKTVRNVDGDLGHCDSASRSDGAPPDRCSALIRIELVALTGEVEEAAEVPVQEPPKTKETLTMASAKTTDVCPPGYVLADGKCTQPAPDLPHACKADNPTECERECARGNAVSCFHRGQQLARVAGSHDEYNLAAQAYLTACERGEPRACFDLGGLFYGGLGLEHSKPNASKLYKMACDAGMALGCGELGRMYYLGDFGESDKSNAVQFYAKGCKGGDHGSCSDLGVIAHGNGDETNARKLFKLACDGGSSYGCTNFGYMVEMGLSVPANPATAVRLYEKGCKAADESCGSLALMTHMGRGTPANEKRALQLYEKACARWDVTSCAVLRSVFGYEAGIAPESRRRLENVWLPTCAQGVSRDCTQLGLLYAAEGDKFAGRTRIAEGCQKGDPFACFIAPKVR